MKRVIALSASLLVVSVAVTAADLSSTEVKRLEDAAAVVRDLRGAPDKGIPEDLWSKADCVTVLPHVKKAAFLVGGEYGKGVMSCRSGSAWSAPVFIEMEKGSAGLQIGGEEADLILLMMNRTGVDKLLQDKVELGADAAVAAGPVGRTASANTDAQLHAGILAYSRAAGAFAGVNVAGGVLRPDKGANDDAYGASIKAGEILAKADIVVPPAARAFQHTLEQETRATTGKKD
jgi:lipid-binding SYLF domain-containing protein